MENIYILLEKAFTKEKKERKKEKEKEEVHSLFPPFRFTLAKTKYRATFPFCISNEWI